MGVQIEATWAVAMSFGFINHGIWDRERGMVLSGSLSIAATLISLAFAPMLFPVGWIVLGCGVALSGLYHHYKAHTPITLDVLVSCYITLGGIIRLLSIHLSTSLFSVWMIWMVLVGLIFITVGIESKNPVMHLLGASCIVVTVASYTFYPELLFLSVTLVFAIGMTVNMVYLYRLLGRTPKIGELFSLTIRALFLHGLKKPIDQYRVIAICIEGNIAAENVIRDLMPRLKPGCIPILLLGPTAPSQIPIPKEAKVGWVATISGAPKLSYSILSPEDPSRVSIFLSKALENIPEGMRPVILGDFLDNMIPHMSESLFHKYYSDLASGTRVLNYTAIFIVKADIHREIAINVVKRFADVIIENREREERDKLVREVRVSNHVDNIHTNWEKYR